MTLQRQGGAFVHSYISHTDLYNPDEGKEYLKNNTLIFKVTEVTVTSI